MKLKSRKKIEKTASLKKFIFFSFFVTSISCYAILPRDREKKADAVDVSSQMPLECTRTGEFTMEFELKCHKLRVALLAFYKEAPEAIAPQKGEISKKSQLRCDEVTDTFVLCKGKRYVLEINAVNDTYSKVKAVNDTILRKPAKDTKDIKDK